MQKEENFYQKGYASKYCTKRKNLTLKGQSSEIFIPFYDVNG
jgi:hypothetical protein